MRRIKREGDPSGKEKRMNQQPVSLKCPVFLASRENRLPGWRKFENRINSWFMAHWAFFHVEPSGDTGTPRKAFMDGIKERGCKKTLMRPEFQLQAAGSGEQNDWAQRPQKEPGRQNNAPERRRRGLSQSSMASPFRQAMEKRKACAALADAKPAGGRNRGGMRVHRQAAVPADS